MGELEELVQRTVEIPSVPQVLLRLQEVVADPDSSISDAVKVLEEDPGLATRCLRMANSAFYGLRVPCASVRQAATVLGMRAVRDLALQSSLVLNYAHLRRHSRFSLDRFWLHAAVSAITARHLARHARAGERIDIETAGACGLLHNIGRLAMLQTFRESYLDVIVPVGSHGAPALQAEMEAFGFDHAVVGGILARRWRLGPELIACTELHHKSGDQVPLVATLIGLADQVAHAVSDSGEEEVSQLLMSPDAQRLHVPSHTVADVVHAIFGQAVDAVSAYA